MYIERYRNTKDCLNILCNITHCVLFVSRYKGKNRAMPTVPNQPSEASAHFMFELAKTVLTKAGGTSSTSLFTQPATSSNHSGPHRHLHLCAFQIGLYALGLHNCVSPNWLSRTYSSHVSWITGGYMGGNIQNEGVKWSEKGRTFAWNKWRIINCDGRFIYRGRFGFS